MVWVSMVKQWLNVWCIFMVSEGLMEWVQLDAVSSFIVKHRPEGAAWLIECEGLARAGYAICMKGWVCNMDPCWVCNMDARKCAILGQSAVWK